MIGIIDESTPWLTTDRTRVLYALALVIVADPTDIAARVTARLNRARPFHWESDTGPNVRRHLIDELAAVNGGTVLAAATCTPPGQTATRRELLQRHLMPVAAELGVIGLVIERRSQRENEHDTRAIRDWVRSEQLSWRPSISHVGKDDPLTWLADAAAGVWSDTLLQRSNGHIETLVGARTVRHAAWHPDW